MRVPPDDSHTDMFATVAVGAPETRWFVPGPTRLPRRPPDRSRIDRYHTPSLAPDRSLKRRGSSGACEWKVRLLPPEPCQVGDVGGQVEHWCKFAGPELGALDDDDDDVWVDVQKLIWRDGLAELASLSALGQEWWSVSVQSCPGRATRLPRWLERKVAGADGVVSGGYPAWLVGLLTAS